MKFQRLYADSAGDSRWQDVRVDMTERVFAPPVQAIEISEPETAKQMMFLRLRAGWNEPIHPTPVPQKPISVAGRVHVTASDGEARDMGLSDVWHMEDCHGKGHQAQVTSTEDFEAVIIQLE
ncbi:hypothetical protein [Pseudorhodobacter ferrugineus]|nr:hypothetical protein [Pseudorhodobacter ferrugineus]